MKIKIVDIGTETGNVKEIENTINKELTKLNNHFIHDVRIRPYTTRIFYIERGRNAKQ